MILLDSQELGMLLDNRNSLVGNLQILKSKTINLVFSHFFSHFYFFSFFFLIFDLELRVKHDVTNCYNHGHTITCQWHIYMVFRID